MVTGPIMIINLAAIVENTLSEKSDIKSLSVTWSRWTEKSIIGPACFLMLDLGLWKRKAMLLLLLLLLKVFWLGNPESRFETGLPVYRRISWSPPWAHESTVWAHGEDATLFQPASSGYGPQWRHDRKWGHRALFFFGVFSGLPPDCQCIGTSLTKPPLGSDLAIST